MKLISWNVNGLKNCIKNGKFEETLKNLNADFFCVQEVKCNEEIKLKELEKYFNFWNFSESKKGYSGTAIFTKKAPTNIYYGIKNEYKESLDKEGRIITLEYPNFYLINCYFPNSKMKRERFNYRLEFNEFFIDYIEKLNFQKNVIICGDFNVAKENIDVCNEYRKKLDNNGFFDEEKASFENLLDLGLIDCFRYYHPQQQKFSWWFDEENREKNIGWRLDYFLVSQELKKNIRKAEILNDIFGSDHCPIELELKLED